MDNLIKNLLTETDCEELLEHLTAIENIISGKLAVLTEKERRKYGSIKEHNKLLVDKVLSYQTHSPSMCSPDVDWDEFRKDYAARKFLESFILRLLSIVFRMESTKILHDYDNYHDALKEHSFSKYKNDIGESGYEMKVTELRQFFSRTGTGGKKKDKKKDEDVNNTPDS